MTPPPTNEGDRRFPSWLVDIRIASKRKPQAVGTFTEVGMQIGLAADTLFGALFGAGHEEHEHDK